MAPANPLVRGLGLLATGLARTRARGCTRSCPFGGMRFRGGARPRAGGARLRAVSRVARSEGPGKALRAASGPSEPRAVEFPPIWWKIRRSRGERGRLGRDADER